MRLTLVSKICDFSDPPPSISLSAILQLIELFVLLVLHVVSRDVVKSEVTRVSAMAPIHNAAYYLDLAALRRELDAGVSPDLVGFDGYFPLQDAIVSGSATADKSIDQRLAFIEALLEAGASVDAKSTNLGRTALHCAVLRLDRNRYPTHFELIVDRLLRAGADVSATTEEGISVLAMAASNGRSTVITKLLSAGAVDPEGFNEPLRRALIRNHSRICALLMRAGGVLELDPDPYANRWLVQSPYLRKVYETPGGFKAYEKAHRQRLTAIFLSKSKFQSLPAEIVSHIVSFGFNCGCY